MNYQPVMTIKHYHIAGLDGACGAADFEQIAGLHAGEHAAAGDRQASLAEGSYDFGGQVEFENFYQLLYQTVFITRL